MKVMETLPQVFSVLRKSNVTFTYIKTLKRTYTLNFFFSLEKCPLSTDLHYLVSSKF